MKSITWLHISDLHWRESNEYEATTVLQELLRDLANRSKIGNTLSRIDVVFATGDVAFSGRPEEYALARRFFDDLLRTLNVPRSRLFIVPGNHDVDREVISTEARHLTEKLTDRLVVNELLADEAGRATVMKRLHRYQQFVNGFLTRDRHFDSARYFYVHRLKIADRQIAILALNSAWRSESDADRTNLLLGERQVREAVERAKKADIRIALMHHPFEWLHDSDREVCERLLLGNCHFVLHGHLHRTGVMRLSDPDISSPMQIAAGAAHSSNEAKAYNLVHLDFGTGKGTVHMRLFSDKGGFWAEDTLSYRNAKGSYQFDLPRSWWESALVAPQKLAPEPLISQPATIAVRTSRAETNRRNLDWWWRQRGYEGNPFICSNAGDIDAAELPGRFSTWYIDPNWDVKSRGYGPTPTLDGVIWQDSSDLVIVYAPAGGGKTFLRRWAAYQINESGTDEAAVEVFNLRERLSDPTLVTGYDLVVCIHDSLYDSTSNNVSPFRRSAESGTTTAMSAGTSQAGRGIEQGAWREQPAQNVDRAKLRQAITGHFDEEELRTLCFDLELDYESLPAKGKAAKAREIVAYAERNGLVSKLLAFLGELRPSVSWGEFSKASIGTQAAPDRNSSNRTHRERSAHAEHMLRECEAFLSSAAEHLRRVYVFVDDIAQLFEEQPDEQGVDVPALIAVADLCIAAATRSGGERLALRLLLPIELRLRIRERLGSARLMRTHEQVIQWSPGHCEAVIEQRLSSFWQGSPGAGSDASLGADTTVTHLGRLLSEDTVGEFRDWLHPQQGLSPRSLIDFFNELGFFAFQSGVEARQIDLITWQQFLARRETGDTQASR